MGFIRLPKEGSIVLALARTFIVMVRILVLVFVAIIRSAGVHDHSSFS
jgi:hypothetical protein